MTTEIHTVAMTDPQRMSNWDDSVSNSNCNNYRNSHNRSSGNDNSDIRLSKSNNNNNGESKYLHKKFKKIASSEGKIFTAARDTPIIDGSIPEVREMLPHLDEPADSRKSGYSCHYCNLTCAKPSVLKKHIRAHTNERPFPCVPCGFAFKTKSNLYKHCRSRTHILKMGGTESTKVSQIFTRLSEDSDVSQSDSGSNGTGTPPPSTKLHVTQSVSSQAFDPSRSPSPISKSYSADIRRTSRIYKPKFHMALQQRTSDCVEPQKETDIKQLKEHNVPITSDNQTILEIFDSQLHKSLHRQQSLIESATMSSIPSRKRCNSENSSNTFSCSSCSMIFSNLDNLRTHRRSYCKSQPGIEYESEPKSESESEQDCYVNSQPLPSPGPLLGHTRLVDGYYSQSTKRRRFEIKVSVRSHEHLSNCPRPNALQMFGGEVRILDKSGESKTMRIEPLYNSTSATMSNNESSNQNPAGPETASIVVRSSLHSGGTMVHKATNVEILNLENEPKEINASSISLADIVPNISPPSIVPSVSCFAYVKPTKILYAGRIIPHVPGMPGPQNFSVNLQPLDLAVANKTVAADHVTTSETNSTINFRSVTIENSVSIARFLRPSSLPLKAGTFTPKRHHGITPTANTLSLISPETPRPKKSYGQLYLNGHAYTYLGLKCSTRLFYCTLNRPQPMYVTQQHSLSMYSNWKICKEIPPELELVHYDSRYRPTRYTLARGCYEDILTHSSHRPSTPSSPDSGPESDGQEKTKQIKIFTDGFESNEDYTHIRSRGRGRSVCEECGIRCEKPSMLKKHMRTHTDVRPYTCKHCTFSFKSKGNLTKHMKSKAHYKKCLELKISPVPTCICDENIDEEALVRFVSTSTSTDNSSSEGSEVESEEHDEHDEQEELDEHVESGSEEREAAQSLLWLSRPNIQKLRGLLSFARPTTYPYTLQKGQTTKNQRDVVESRYDVVGLDKKDETAIFPIDLTTKQPDADYKIFHQTNVLAGISDPKLLQTIVQTVADRDWPQRVQHSKDQMLQAYLTERHLMDSKIKQQYHIIREEVKECLQQSPTPSLPSTSLNPSISPNCFSITTTPNKSNFLSKKEKEDTQSIELLQSIPEFYEFRNEKLSTTQQVKSTSETDDRNLKLAMSEADMQTRKVIVDGSEVWTAAARDQHNPSKLNLEFCPPSNTKSSHYVSITEDNRSVCGICNKVFSKPSQLRLHINIHYFERPFRCESCGTSFRTKGHLTKHERSSLHHNKVSMTSTFGTATASNPRPFKCIDCKSAFRIHGHLAKHLRSKMHIMKLECLRKLPFGTYAEMERSGVNLNDIDTTDCDTSLSSLQIMAQKLYEKDPDKMEKWEIGMVPNPTPSGGESSEDGEANPVYSASQCMETEIPKDLYGTLCNKSDDLNLIAVSVDNERTDHLMYKCNLCPRSLRNLSELHVHCFVEHNVQPNNTSTIRILTNINEKIRRIDEGNTHQLERVDGKCTIIEEKSDRRLDTP